MDNYRLSMTTHFWTWTIHELGTWSFDAKHMTIQYSANHYTATNSAGVTNDLGTWSFDAKHMTVQYSAYYYTATNSAGVTLRKHMKGDNQARNGKPEFNQRMLHNSYT